MSFNSKLHNCDEDVDIYIGLHKSHESTFCVNIFMPSKVSPKKTGRFLIKNKVFNYERMFADKNKVFNYEVFLFI